jgi:hypothetical protein
MDKLEERVALGPEETERYGGIVRAVAFVLRPPRLRQLGDVGGDAPGLVG